MHWDFIPYINMTSYLLNLILIPLFFFSKHYEFKGIYAKLSLVFGAMGIIYLVGLILFIAWTVIPLSVEIGKYYRSAFILVILILLLWVMFYKRSSGILIEQYPIMKSIFYVILIHVLWLPIMIMPYKAEVLNAFKLVDQGIQNSVSSRSYSNDSLYKDLFSNLADDLLISKIDQMQNDVTKLHNYLDSLNDLIITESGGYDKDGRINKPDDTYSATTVMVKNNNGYVIKNQINQVRNVILDLVKAEDREYYAVTMPLKADDSDVPDNGDVKRDWVQYNFEDVPAIAAITILSKLQNDLSSAERDILEYVIDKY